MLKIFCPCWRSFILLTVIVTTTPSYFVLTQQNPAAAFNPDTQKLEITEDSLMRFIVGLKPILEETVENKFIVLPEIKIVSSIEFKKIIQAGTTKAGLNLT